MAFIVIGNSADCFRLYLGLVAQITGLYIQNSFNSDRLTEIKYVMKWTLNLPIAPLL